MLTDDDIAKMSSDLAIHSTFCVVRHWRGSRPDASTFAERREFFFLVKRFLQEGKLRLAKNGVFLDGDVDHHVGCFSAAFPATDEDVDMGGAGVWFFSESCPAGAVWVMKTDAGDEWLEWT